MDHDTGRFINETTQMHIHMRALCMNACVVVAAAAVAGVAAVVAVTVAIVIVIVLL